MKVGEKAYMIFKSTGASMSKVRAGMARDSIPTTDIMYHGRHYEDVIIAYFKSADPDKYIFSYKANLTGGDYYLRGDFVTHEEVTEGLYKSYPTFLPEELFDI
jgi:hypothetical protein